MLDLNRLRVLHEVARAGSFSKAARILLITPSAVSQQIAALERSVGTPVVARSPRGITLTEAGRLLAESAADLLAGVVRAERHIEGVAKGLTGRLAIATFPSAGQRLVPRALAPITAREGVEVTVYDAEPEFALPLIEDGTVDVGVVYHFLTETPPAAWGSLTHTLLLEEKLYALLPERHPWADRPAVPLSALADDCWIHGIGGCAAFLEQLCLTAGFEQKVACRSADYNFCKTMVAAGIGVALLPTLALEPRVEGTRVVPLETPAHRYVGVVHRTAAPTPLVGELIDLLRDSAQLERDQ